MISCFCVRKDRCRKTVGKGVFLFCLLSCCANFTNEIAEGIAAKTDQANQCDCSLQLMVREPCSRSGYDYGQGAETSSAPLLSATMGASTLLRHALFSCSWQRCGILVVLGQRNWFPLVFVDLVWFVRRKKKKCSIQQSFLTFCFCGFPSMLIMK